jgi:hypothetical protein
VPLGEGRESLQIGEEDADVTFLASELGDLGLRAQTGGQLRREIWPEQTLDRLDLASSAFDDRGFVGAESYEQSVLRRRSE